LIGGEGRGGGSSPAGGPLITGRTVGIDSSAPSSNLKTPAPSAASLDCLLGGLVCQSSCLELGGAQVELGTIICLEHFGQEIVAPCLRVAIPNKASHPGHRNRMGIAKRMERAICP
jgi:hypothetical protein